jgi:cytochrome c peroxidase
MNASLARLFVASVVLLSLGIAVGVFARDQARQPAADADRVGPPRLAARSGAPVSERLMPDTPAGVARNWRRPYPQYQPLGDVLEPFPEIRPGTIVPQRLYRHGGAGPSSFASVDDVRDFDVFFRTLSAQKRQVMAERSAYMHQRYDFTGNGDSSVTMTRGKPVPVGPVVRLPAGVPDWVALAALSPEEIYRRDLFPEGFRPLSHPLHSTGHQLFPQFWTKLHPEHERFDVDFDLPDAYLPEFPPPLFLSTRPDLGDVSQGYEITQANFRQLFDGIITPEQLEGLRLLVTKFPTTWFNHTKHRLTAEPVRGTACLDCHVNGHANGAIELDPGTRPMLARVRLDTPSLRGNYANEMFSIKRSIRTTDHFAEIEEYFDGDISLQPQIGGRQLDKVSTNRMGDFNSIIDFPPAPKLDRMGVLDPRKATAAEQRGQTLFNTKARCVECHRPPYYTDNTMHDLRVEEFYRGRAEGVAKTFSLRGIRDSPPYFHDGRLPTLEDVVEFFNLILQTRLTVEEKKDLVAFLRAL